MTAAQKPETLLLVGVACIMFCFGEFLPDMTEVPHDTTELAFGELPVEVTDVMVNEVEDVDFDDEGNPVVTYVSINIAEANAGAATLIMNATESIDVNAELQSAP